MCACVRVCVRVLCRLLLRPRVSAPSPPPHPTSTSSSVLPRRFSLSISAKRDIDYPHIYGEADQDKSRRRKKEPKSAENEVQWKCARWCTSRTQRWIVCAARCAAAEHALTLARRLSPPFATSTAGKAARAPSCDCHGGRGVHAMQQQSAARRAQRRYRRFEASHCACTACAPPLPRPFSCTPGTQGCTCANWSSRRPCCKHQPPRHAISPPPLPASLFSWSAHTRHSDKIHTQTHTAHSPHPHQLGYTAATRTTPSLRPTRKLENHKRQTRQPTETNALPFPPPSPGARPYTGTT